ncbi:MAG TPA: ABC transporter substrate-binding protein [Thermomicrobiales bacterium]
MKNGPEAVNSLVMDVLHGRLSRRDVMKRAAAIGLSASTIGMLMRISEAAAQGTPAAGGSLEVFSWWTSPGEAPALQALFDAFLAQYPGVEIINAAVAGGGGGAAQAVLQTRLQGNNPPDSWQSHPGHELFDQYVDAGYCEPITDLYTSEGWTDVMPAGLVEQVTRDGEQYAIAVGVHRGNGFWYNKQVLADAGIEVGETMTIDEFMQAAETLQGRGITPLALGSKDAFVAAQTFENTLLGVVGPENYNKLFAGELSWDDDSVKEAMQVTARMFEMVNSDHSALTWDGAVDLVIQGKAAFNSMGDWAYGEFVAKNVVDNIGWVSHPGTAGSFVLVVDCFTLAQGAPNAENARNWLRVIGTKEAQEAFNPLKGSIPARTDVDQSIFSAYHQWSMNSFANDMLVPSVAHGQAASPQFKQAMYDAAAAFLVDKDVETFALMLVDAAGA